MIKNQPDPPTSSRKSAFLRSPISKRRHHAPASPGTSLGCVTLKRLPNCLTLVCAEAMLIRRPARRGLPSAPRYLCAVCSAAKHTVGGLSITGHGDRQSVAQKTTSVGQRFVDCTPNNCIMVFFLYRGRRRHSANANRINSDECQRQWTHVKQKKTEHYSFSVDFFLFFVSELFSADNTPSSISGADLSTNSTPATVSADVSVQFGVPFAPADATEDKEAIHATDEPHDDDTNNGTNQEIHSDLLIPTHSHRRPRSDGGTTLLRAKTEASLSDAKSRSTASMSSRSQQQQQQQPTVKRISIQLAITRLFLLTERACKQTRRRGCWL